MKQAFWRASLRAPDGTELSEAFPGAENDNAVRLDGVLWLRNTALPRMLQAAPANDDMTVHHHAHERFQDALLSEPRDIVSWCDPWEMRLEHYPAEAA